MDAYEAGIGLKLFFLPAGQKNALFQVKPRHSGLKSDQLAPDDTPLDTPRMEIRNQSLE